ncbi:tRNA pseudouridine synthase 1 [Erysiphe neolycopersici]|uniref:tRNA pseudouridine synthase 1 n=1 Tax=Erysiphe neolycopersici TaxID=212602 RepID=A0A420HL10_9PEZI|nr:tRNA pseudouridine synthase 1 [Erysiphe neolycopersici]
MAEEKPPVESGKDASPKPNKPKNSSTNSDNQQGNLDEESKISEISHVKSQREKRCFLDGGNRRGYGSKNQNGGRNKEEVSRAEWSRGKLDKRKRNEDYKSTHRKKKDRGDRDNEDAGQFSLDNIKSEERKPKRKVAVMIGYAGTGYKGMQINAEEKTIEGDIFKAFVAAGAISKANADDPKKSSLVRCARTDKGVHAAGNVISLKLIVEDNDIVQKINENLPPQIRVWGYERTNGGFSCYQSCDSRWYEYLIPSNSFLPPHPNSYLGKKLIESAKSEGYLKEYLEAQEDVSTFWECAMKEHVESILNKLDSSLREAVMLAVHKETNYSNTSNEAKTQSPKVSKKQGPVYVKTEELKSNFLELEQDSSKLCEAQSNLVKSEDIKVEESEDNQAFTDENQLLVGDASRVNFTPLELAVREVKAAYTTARKLYRISSKRRARIQEALNEYLGTHNFHNYTIQKKYTDPSAKRVIKSFDLATEPIIINQTEWLSMKVHGQSFMMHQIRKMIGMIALVIRCATPLKIIQESYGYEKISIPKAPGLGLLLERPVFSTYNQRAVTEFHREMIDFDKYKTQMDEFKQREIYERIFREEESDHQLSLSKFLSYFTSVFRGFILYNHYQSSYFLWVTATGIPAVKNVTVKEEKKFGVDSENDADFE